MSYSAEESSPLTNYETCCVCDEEFSSEGELTEHLIKHTEDEEFKESLVEFEQKKSAPSTPISSSTSSRPTPNSITPSKRTYNQRSTSPEVLVISDDSGDESAKSKAPKLTTNARSVYNTNSKSNGQKLPNKTVSSVGNTVQGANNALQRRNVQQGPSVPKKNAQGSVNQTQQNNVQKPNFQQNNGMKPINTQRKSGAQQINNGTPKSSAVQQPLANAPKSLSGTPQGTSKIQTPQSSSGAVSKGPPYNCPICKKIFQDSNSYREHVQSHKKSFSCHICNKSFAFEATLRDHLLKHVGEKSHECKKCHMKFSMKNILAKHEKICTAGSAKKPKK